MVTTGSGISTGRPEDFAIEVDFKPSIALTVAAFNTLGVNVKSFKEPLKRAIKKVMIPSIKENFDVGGRPTWEPLSEETQIRKVNSGARFYDALKWTGRLYRTAQQQNIWTITREEAYIADLPDAVWYGKVHQEGAVGGFGSYIPQREFLMFQDKDFGDIEEVFFVWIEERAVAAGFGVF